MNENTKTKRTIIIVASLILVITAVAITYSVINQLNQPNPQKSANIPDEQPVQQDPSTQNPDTPPAKVSDDEVKQAITKSSPDLIDNAGMPGFEIVKSVNPTPGWYVVTLRNTTTTAEGARVILNNQNGTLVVVAGPGTYFSPKLDIPSAVRKALTQ